MNDEQRRLIEALRAAADQPGTATSRERVAAHLCALAADELEQLLDAKTHVGNVASDRNTGHGHVFPRPDAAKARCGGPGLCSECSKDLARKNAKPTQDESLVSVSPQILYAQAFRAWADHPAESGYVPVSPSTLRLVATLLEQQK